MIHRNPFSLIHDEVWRMLETDTDFNALVRVGNRIHLNKENDRDIIKTVASTADLPEILVIDTGFTTNLANTSSSSQFTYRTSIILNTGDYRQTAILSPLTWLLFCKFNEWQRTFCALLWCNKTFVKRVAFLDSSIGDSDPDRNRQIKGFTGVCTFEFECYIKKSDCRFNEVEESSSES